MGNTVGTAPPVGGEETWRLHDLSPPDRGEGWREVVACTHLPWHVDDPPVDLGRPFDAAVRRRWFTDLALLDCRCDPCAGGRGMREVRRTGTDQIAVLCVLAGREIIEQDGRQVELRPGDMTVWDSDRPARFAVLEPLRKRTLLLPRSVLQSAAHDLPGDRRSWTARLFPRGALAVDLLRAHLETLARPRPPGADATDLAARMAADLVAACLTLTARSRPEPDVVDGDGGRPSASAVRRATLLAAVHAAIDRRLALVAAHGVPLQPGELNPGAVAAKHAMSVRALHQLCEGHGEGLSARVRRLRLEGARRQLQEGGSSTVAAIALRWGFADAAHFSRAYKEHFGERPRDTVARAWSDRECLQQEFPSARHPRGRRDVAPGDDPSTRTAR